MGRKQPDYKVSVEYTENAITLEEWIRIQARYIALDMFDSKYKFLGKGEKHKCRAKGAYALFAVLSAK